MRYSTDHDVHHFANGVTLVRANPGEAFDLRWWHYDRGHGIILVERGTGKVCGFGGGLGSRQYEKLRRSLHGMMPDAS
jgi:hypothetical protein